MPFAELIARSNFTFLDGASHPEELVARAHALGLDALALTDVDSLAGMVRAHEHARKVGLHLVVGAEVSFVDQPPLVLLAKDLEGYSNLCELAAAGALEGFGMRRREALWKVHGLGPATDDLFAGVEPREPPVTFDEGSRAERLGQDFAATGLSTLAHPMALVRARLPKRPRLLRSDELARMPAAERVHVGGMAIIRQRPATAKGIVFVTLEDEQGFVNVVVMPDVWERHRFDGGQSQLLGCAGVVERSGKAVTVKAERLYSLDEIAGDVEPPASRDFR